MPADAPASPAAETPTAAPAPVDILTPQDATAERIARTLPPEQAKIFKANRAAKKAAKAQATATPAAPAPAAPAVETPTEKPTAIEAPAPEVETLVLGEESDTTTTTTTGDEPPAAAELTEAELSALDDKAKKRVIEASKEAAKVRKRAQESEAKAKELEQQLATLKAEAEENTTRSIGLTGNSFAQFKNASEVAKWGTNAQEAIALLRSHDRQIKAGRADADATVLHLLPDGREVDLSLADAAFFENRIADARTWFEHDDVASKNRATAQKLAEKHKDLKGYAEARASYLKDHSLTARIEELVSKAALYDVLHSRKASISFSDTAGAATSATSPRATGSENAHRKTPPSESPASTPRLAAVDSEGSDVQRRKSDLMQQVRDAKTEDERQNLLKQAIKLGPSRLSAAVRR
jgi:hypothetical protein